MTSKSVSSDLGKLFVSQILYFVYLMEIVKNFEFSTLIFPRILSIKKDINIHK